MHAEIILLGMSNDLWSARTKSRGRTNLDGQTNGRTKSSKHVDERVNTEEVDPPTEKIIDARLNLLSLSNPLLPHYAHGLIVCNRG